MRVKISFWISVFIPFGYIPRSGTGGSYTSPIFFFFGGFSILFSIVTVPVNNVYFLNSRCSLSLSLSLSLSHTHTHIHTYTHKEPCLILCDPMDSIARQPPPSMGFARQEYWSGLPLPSPGALSDTGIERWSLALLAYSLPLSHQGSPYIIHTHTYIFVCVCILRYIQMQKLQVNETYLKSHSQKEQQQKKHPNLIIL